MICKLKARLNLHGVLNVEQGYYVEDQEVEEPIPEEKKDGDAMDTDQPNGEAEKKPKMRKVKKQVRKGDLPLVAGTASMDQATKDAASERENQMFMEDKLVQDTEHVKNELESYIYEMRDKIDTVYADFASDEEKEKLKEKCQQTEDWLYYDEEGEDATKAVYTAKLEDLRAIAGPIRQRYMDKIEEERMAKVRAKEEAEAKKRAEEARKKAEEDAKKAAQPETKDEEMKDADAVQPDAVEEPAEQK